MFIVQKLNFDWCACTSEKVVKHDSGEKEGRILRFKGCFVFFGAILAYNRPKKVKNIEKKACFWKTSRCQRVNKLRATCVFEARFSMTGIYAD